MTNISQRSALPPSTLIICSRNRPRLLEETVESVLAGEELPSELLIIDQSDARHPSIQNAKRGDICQVRYVWTRSRGLSRARNEGIKSAAHEVVCFIDDDVHVPANWYRALMQAVLRAGPKSAITGRVLPGGAEKRGGFVPSLVTGDKPQIYRGRIGTDVLAGCHMAMYRTAFAKVGGFDERLGAGTRFGAEDNDMGFRLLEAGYQIIYVPEAVLYHRAWRGDRDYLPTRWAYGRAKGGFYAKYANLRDPYILQRMCRDIAIRVIRFPWRFLHNPRLALGDMAYVGGMLSGALDWCLSGESKRPAGTSLDL